MALYLSVSIPALAITLRYTLARWAASWQHLAAARRLLETRSQPAARARPRHGIHITGKLSALMQAHTSAPPATACSLLAGSTESGEVVPTTRRQDVMLAALTLVPSLSVALAFPGSGALHPLDSQ